MRHARLTFVAAMIVAASSSILVIRETCGQETIVVTEDPAAGDMTPPGSDCGCKGVQRPPWHDSVRGPACGPVCAPHGGVFHADPRGQLQAKHQCRSGHVRLPSCFPRLHTWCAEGYMPTPRPLALPRCHQCGAPIEPGF